MPATITEEPPGIACVFSNGTRAEFVVEGLPNPRLARDLLVGLVELIHPHGTVNAAHTVDFFVRALRNMVTTLAARGFAGGAAQLTRPQLAEYWMGTTFRWEACTRRMLQGFHTATRELSSGARELAEGRAFNPQPLRRVLPPYTETEWTRLTRTCRTIADEAFTAHKNALAAAERGRHPNDGGWNDDNLRWLLARVGPVGTAGFGRHLGCSENVVRNRGGILHASAELFPTLDVVIAYRLLFGSYSGIVPDGIDDLVVDDIDWAGDTTILLSYVKGRTAEPDPATAGGTSAGAVAGPFGTATRTRRSRRAPPVVAGGEQARRNHGDDRSDRSGGHPTLGPSPWCDERRRRPVEDSPAPDPHHAPGDA
jgi:hypothetical protein